ncbi:hypothetical protein OMW55_09955 [Sphingomonas sp. BN140010]|uniref:Uncharacterized protein n=1 Tax=Sphingomonas arvum TaxID=2992113 RepID=A0ABT3JGB5_9SPHN|nr:hypothetical protein [Sphingomonas sp. BN140010]MCW3798127.1 hypothetical protein [Sphingomonas sp. BN140010]
MRLFAFVSTTAAYALAATIIYASILLHCGLGPDSPAACNNMADRQGAAIRVGAIIFYAVLAFAYWRRWPKLKG